MTVDASEISVVVAYPDDISVVIDCAQPVEATVELGGPPGASSYDIWLQQPGNAGKTVSEYLESLRGPPGNTGDPGPPGQDATGLSGFPVVFNALMPGDLLEFSATNAWVNGRPQSLTDGGNF